jgi:hypothetical protein
MVLLGLAPKQEAGAKSIFTISARYVIVLLLG